MDAVDVVKAPGPCFLYLDPPYVKIGKDFYHQRMDEAQHRRLADALIGREHPWLLSYDDSDLVKQLYQSQVVRTLEVKRPNAKNKSKLGTELLICSSKFPGILPDPPVEYPGFEDGPSLLTSYW